MVTWSLLAVMAVVAVGQLELWPLTAFRLFSEVRTADQTRLELVAEHLDGTEEPLLVSETNPVLVTTDRQFPDLPREPEEVQREMVLAWLGRVGRGPGDGGVGAAGPDRPRSTTWTPTRGPTSAGRPIVDVDL